MSNEKFNFQEPCCIERTLPMLIKEYPFCTWQSNGDITFEKIIKAVSHLAGTNLDITLLLPNVELHILRVLDWYRRRGWLKSLTIVTTTDESATIRKEFPTDFPVEILSHKSIIDSLLIIRGTDGHALVQGPLHATPSNKPTVERFTTYVGNDPEQIAMLTATTSSRLANLRRKKKKDSTAPSENQETNDHPTQSEPADQSESFDNSDESDKSDESETSDMSDNSDNSEQSDPSGNS